MGKIFINGQDIDVEGNFIHALARHPNTLKQEMNIPEKRTLTTKPELGREINILNPTPELNNKAKDTYEFVITNNKNEDYNYKNFVFLGKTGSLISNSTEYSSTIDSDCGIWVHRSDNNTLYVVYINEDWFKISTVFVDPYTWNKKTHIEVHNTEMLDFYGNGTYYYNDEEKGMSVRGPKNGVTWS